MNGNGRAHESRPAASKLQPWPLFVVGLLVAFLAVQAVMVAVASRGFEGPDDPDYYADGLSRAVAAQDRAEARARGWRLELQVPPRSGAVLRLRVRDAHGRPLDPARVEVKLGRPATMREDHPVRVQATGPGAFAGIMAAAPGTWDVTVTVRCGGGLLIRKLRTEIAASP